jgi:hypothetical protein
MNQQTKLDRSIKRQLSKIILTAALALTTLAPFVVSAASDQTQSMQDTATPTPTSTPTPIAPPTELNVSWNT